MSSAPGAPDESGVHPEIDLSKVRTVPFHGRASRVSSEAFAKLPNPEGTFGDFLASLPDILEAASFKAVARGVARAVKDGRGVLWMLGGHTIKTGLAPLLIRMMERRAATVIAGNGSVAIHDYEVARWGVTSEDVEAGLGDGTFGMAEETGREMNEALATGARKGMGFGEALGRALSRREDLVAPHRSILLQAYLRGIPVDIHAAIGCEIIHQHPTADGASIGECSMRDFRRLAEALPSLDGGGAVLNLGSAVIMPEVFLKALALARNVHDGKPRRFLAADFDMIRHYRPGLNVVQRPTRSGGGEGYRITGHHEIMIPLLAWAVEEYLAG
ncbi:MAG: hypothetical protein PVJ76_16565 [Gemmatimonadota bacterium]